MPDLALSAGAVFAADGKVVNNVLGFPGILRGAVEVQRQANQPPHVPAAAETSCCSYSPGELLPNPLDKRLHMAGRRSGGEASHCPGSWPRAEFRLV